MHLIVSGVKDEMKQIAAQTKKAGQLPGSLVHIGRGRETQPSISVMAYNQSTLIEKSGNDAWLTLEDGSDPADVLWVHLDGIHQADILEKLGRRFGIHSLVLEDILNTGQRPKMEENGDTVFFGFENVS